MSRQFRFYLLPPQIEEMISALKEQVGFRLIAARSQTQTPTELKSVFETFTDSTSGQQIVHVHCYLVPPFEAPLATLYAPRMNDWYTESERSEVIQFSGCDYDGNKLRIGRFYFQTNYLNEAKDALVPHREQFLKWGDQIFRAAKRHMKYSRELAAYVDDEVELWRQQGGSFVGI
jgi:hypothetical protein